MDLCPSALERGSEQGLRQWSGNSDFDQWDEQNNCFPWTGHLSQTLAAKCEVNFLEAIMVTGQPFLHDLFLEASF